MTTPREFRYISEQTLTPEASRAFINTITIPPTGQGPLSGLRLAVKDLIDVVGQVTGGGNPTWAATHPSAAAHATCVEMLLASGAEIVGKTITDELAFSLLGENHHYGTPLNPLAPDRLPGGSSSGSASAVASGCAEIALGTDTGGSVRVPASNCGLFGLRPTHNRISLAGVMELAPSFDAVGIFARSLHHLAITAEILLGEPMTPPDVLPRIERLLTVWDATDPEIVAALEPAARLLEATQVNVTLESIAAGMALTESCEIYRLIQGIESWSCLGSWLTSANPIFGPKLAPGIDLWRQRDRSKLVAVTSRRDAIRRALNTYLGGDRVLMLPTTPTVAPRIDDDVQRDTSPQGYFTRTLGITGIAGIAKLPQLTLPVGNVGGVPVGLSLIGSVNSEAGLIALAQMIA